MMPYVAVLCSSLALCSDFFLSLSAFWRNTEALDLDRELLLGPDDGLEMRNTWIGHAVISMSAKLQKLWWICSTAGDERVYKLWMLSMCVQFFSVNVQIWLFMQSSMFFVSTTFSDGFYYVKFADHLAPYFTGWKILPPLLILVFAISPKYFTERRLSSSWEDLEF